MRLSQYWLHTQKETPAEAEVISHQLLLRAGMIRQSALGIYSWLPLGLRVLRKVETVLREERNPAAGPPTVRSCCASKTGTSANSASAPPMRRWLPTWCAAT